MKTPLDSPHSEITPEHVYFSRRNFMKAGALAASVAATGWVYRRLNSPSRTVVNTAPITLATSSGSGFRVDEESTSLEDITHYNNFYEFSTNKDAVADAAADFNTAGWKVEVGGFPYVARQTTDEAESLR